MAGISKSTFYGWLKKAEDGDSRFLEFSDAVKKARAESEGAHIMNIRKAADNGVWQAQRGFWSVLIRVNGVRRTQILYLRIQTNL